MLPYLLTALAGIVVGIVAARVWLIRDAALGAEQPAPAPPGLAPPSKTKSWPVSTIALAGAGILALGSVAIIAFRGEDQGSTSPASPTALSGGSIAPSAASGLDDVDVMIERLAKRLETAPDDGEGFRMLGWSYVNTNKPDKAITAYKRALELLPQRADVHAGYGESLVGLAGGTVTPEAKASFDKAIKLDPKEPRARFFEALYKAQHGDRKEALAAWIDLANGGPADAAWQADLRKHIDETAKALGEDVSGRLNAAPPVAAADRAAPPRIDSATVAAASALPPADQKAMVDKMVEGLAQKLAANPADPDGWIRLLRSRMVLKQADQAGRDLAIARRALAKTPADLARVNAAARELEVPAN